MIQSIKYIICTVVLTAVIGTASGQKVMTLEECRKQAVEFNKELKNAALQRKEALVNQEVARTAYFPGFSGDIPLTFRWLVVNQLHTLLSFVLPVQSTL